MSDTVTKRQEFFAMALAVEVQLTEGVSVYFPRMKELRKYLRPKHDARILDAYNRGYFLPDEAWVDKFSKRMLEEFNFSPADGNFYQPELIDELRGYIPADLLEDVCKFIDGFEG